MKRPDRLAVLLGVGALLALAAGCADDSAQAGTAAAPTTTGPASTTTAPAATTTTAPNEAPGDTAPPQDPAPHLELMNTGDHLELFSSEQYGTSTGFGTAAVYVAAVGGQFELTVSRPTFADDVVATARLGSRRVDFGGNAPIDFDAMEEFAHATLRSGDGTTVLDSDLPFCPSSGLRIRTSPDGPPIDRFATTYCGASIYARATRWGIADGWAASLTDLITTDVEGPLAAGEYELDLEINEPYDELFEGDTSLTVPVTVTDDSDPESGGVAFEDVPLSGVDADGDGLDDSVDEFIDLDGDGLDDTSQLTEEEIFGIDGAGATDFGEVYLSQDVIAEEAESADENHQGRPGPDANPAKSTLPDLVSLPALGFQITNADSLDLLGFEAITWNAGRAPMMVDGFVRKDDPSLMDAYQQFFDHGVPAGSAPIGTLEYHAGGGHDHWHFLDFSRYELVGGDGAVIQRAGKESWCLANTDAIDLTLPGAPADGGGDLSTECGDEGSRWIRETLAVGWGDAYSPYVSGQYFDITDLPNGRYLVRLTANPEGNMYESDTTNNVADREITLGGTPGNRTVRAAKVGQIDTEEFFEPTGFGA